MVNLSQHWMIKSFKECHHIAFLLVTFSCFANFHDTHIQTIELQVILIARWRTQPNQTSLIYGTTLISVWSFADILNPTYKLNVGANSLTLPVDRLTINPLLYSTFCLIAHHLS